MRFFLFIGHLAWILFFYPLFAAEVCSRMATINFQRVLVDVGSTQKGEGLRYHLEKDPKAKAYLEAYQEGAQIKWHSAALGLLGTGLLLGGAMAHDDESQKTLLISGATVTVANFLIAKTLANANESNLLRAVEEYNKRNLPKIYLNSATKGSTSNFFAHIGFGFNKSWSF